MENKAGQTVKKYDMLCQNDTVIVGLSGGADSCALLHFLLSLREKLQLTVVACHVNHQLRGEEADRDEQFVRGLCEQYQVPLYVLHADVGGQALQQKKSTEQCGRDIRYAFFAETAGKLHAKIATAHTASDNVETVLFNLARGSGAAGLCGIPPVRDNIIRPLIECTREEIETYCRVHHLEYVTDSTNLTGEYTRNKIRLAIIPVLKEINPSLENTVSGMTVRLRETVNFINECAENALAAAITPKGYRTECLQTLSDTVLAQALKILCQQYGVTPEAKHIELIKKIVYNHGAVEIRQHIFAVSGQGFLRIVAEDESHTSPIMGWQGQETLCICNKKITLCKINAEEFYNRKKIDKMLFHNSLDYDTIPLSGVFRTRCQGDRFSPVRRNVTKSVKKLFIEEKIPQEQRDKTVLFADGSDILWIEGIGVAEQYAVHDDTQNVLVINCTDCP